MNHQEKLCTVFLIFAQKVSFQLFESGNLLKLLEVLREELILVKFQHEYHETEFVRDYEGVLEKQSQNLF